MTRLGPGGSSGVLPCALRPAQASIGFRGGIRPSGTWHPPGCVIAWRTIPPRGPRFALRKDAGVMVISDPS
ncbi:hypothetical protein F5883DRAFT_478282 [Diaporthe sp. PMI_573]|nr:hypothetical protein F5883DRAFT_478282 [Diaporthaceae sp. PMI_573]